MGKYDQLSERTANVRRERAGAAVALLVVGLVFLWLVGLGVRTSWYPHSLACLRDIACWPAPGETSTSIDAAEGYVKYGARYLFLQVVQPPTEAGPAELYTHNVNVGAFLLFGLTLIGLGPPTDPGRAGPVSALIFGVGLLYAFLCLRRLSGSSTFGLIFLLLLGTDYYFSLAFGLTAIRNLHWAALFGAGYHLGSWLTSTSARGRWHLAGFFVLAAIGFGIGYDFVAIQGLFCVGLVLWTVRPGPRSWRPSVGPLAVVVVAFLVPFVLRQLQVIGHLGLDFWWHDLYYSAVIKTSFLNRWLALPDLAAIDDWYRQHSVLRPPASPETSPLRVWETVMQTVRDVWIPRFGATRLGLALVGWTLAFGMLSSAFMSSRSVAARPPRCGGAAPSKVDPARPSPALVRAAAVTVVLTATQVAGIYFFSPLSIHIYLKHAMPAFVAPLLIGHALLLLVLGHLVIGGWRRLTRRPLAGRLIIVAAALLVAAIVGLHVDRQLANVEDQPLYSREALVFGLRTTPTILEFPCPDRRADPGTGADSTCRANDERLPAGAAAEIAYVPTVADLSGVPPAAHMAWSFRLPPDRVRAATVEAALVDGAVSYTGDSYEMWRSLGDGRFRRIVGAEGQRVSVSGIGPWDVARAEFTGLEVVASGQHWLPDLSGLRPVNEFARFGELTNDGRAPLGWQIGPPDADATVTRHIDEEGPFVRITVRRADDGVLLYSAERAPGGDEVPLAARARVRARAATGLAHLSLSEQLPTGASVDFVSQAQSDGEWRTLVLNVERSMFSGGTKVVYVGLLGALPGDVFEIRELDVFVGIIP